MNGKLRTLIESDAYQKQSERIANIKFIDEAVRILCNSIAFSPEVFAFVTGFEKIQLAKTDAYSRSGVDIPALRLWFRQLNDNEIELLAIEPFEK